MATSVLKNPARVLEIDANVGSAFALRNPKAVLSILPEVINFYCTGKGFYLGNFVGGFVYLIDYTFIKHMSMCAVKKQRFRTKNKEDHKRNQEFY